MRGGYCDDIVNIQDTLQCIFGANDGRGLRHAVSLAFGCPTFKAKMTTEEIRFWDEGKFDSLDKEKFDCCLIDVLSVLLAYKEIHKKIRQPSPCLPSNAPIRCTNFVPFPDSKNDNGNNEPSALPKCKEKFVDPVSSFSIMKILQKWAGVTVNFSRTAKTFGWQR